MGPVFLCLWTSMVPLALAAGANTTAGIATVTTAAVATTSAGASGGNGTTAAGAGVGTTAAEAGTTIAAKTTYIVSCTLETTTCVQAKKMANDSQISEQMREQLAASMACCSKTHITVKLTGPDSCSRLLHEKPRSLSANSKKTQVGTKFEVQSSTKPSVPNANAFLANVSAWLQQYDNSIYDANFSLKCVGGLSIQIKEGGKTTVSAAKGAKAAFFLLAALLAGVLW